MKRRFAVCTIGFAIFCAVSAGAIHAQSANPAATVAPSQPSTDTPAPTASAAASPAQTSPAPTESGKVKRSAEEKAVRKAERLRKYDVNKDGKLDEQERAAMRADKATP